MSTKCGGGPEGGAGEAEAEAEEEEEEEEDEEEEEAAAVAAAVDGDEEALVAAAAADAEGGAGEEAATEGDARVDIRLVYFMSTSSVWFFHCFFFSFFLVRFYPGEPC